MCVWGVGQGEDKKEPNTQPMTRAEAPAAFGSRCAIAQGLPEKGPRAPPLVSLLGISCRTIWDTLLHVLRKLATCTVRAQTAQSKKVSAH